MKTTLFAIVLSATLAQPASAITFPSLTTIYVGSGVRDDTGIATAFNCSNVSGVSAQVRFLVLGINGALEADVTVTIPHGGTRTGETRGQSTFSNDFSLQSPDVGQGVINIESTQSAVFCNAMIVDEADAADGITLPLVRVNPHPGTVE